MLAKGSPYGVPQLLQKITSYISYLLPNKVRPLLVKCVVQECPRNRFGIEIRISKWGSYGGADLRRDLHFVAAVEISNLSCYFFALSLGFGSCNAEKAQLNLF